MANVPTYGPRKQTLNPVFTNKMDSRATPEAFGAGVGRAMGNLARGVGQLGNAVMAVQEMEDKAIVDQRVNTYSDYTRERTYDPETGYLTLQGENAVSGRGTFEDDLEEQRKALGEDLSPAQQRLFNDATEARRRQALDTAVRHASGQRKQWFDEASTARLGVFADDAMAMSDEPEKLALNLAAASREIADKAAVNGWSPEQTAAAQEEFLSGVHKNIVLKNAIADPLKAKDWLEQHRDVMTQAHQYELDNALDGPVLATNAQLEAERIMRGEDSTRPARLNATGRVDHRLHSSTGADTENIKPDTQTAFGRLQTSMGTQLEIVSGYRDKARNAAAGGAEGSRHMHGDAIDIDVRGMSKAERLTLIEKAFDAGFTGIGVGANSIHIDQGNPRAWGYATSAGGGPVPQYASALIEQRLGALRNGKTPTRNAAPANISTGGVDSAAAMLRQFEGSKTNAYWDVNHYRTGYGSDTWTDAQGGVHTTQKGTVITQEDAERDLTRRLGAANQRLQKEFGTDTWMKISPEARGALLSVDYNYGTLPEAVKTAVATGDVEAIADAVLGLQGDNGGVNKERRQKEAATIRGGGLPDGVTVSGTNAFVGPQYIADQVAGIADPRLRAATAAAISKQYTAQDAAQRRADRQNKIAVEQFIIQNPGTDPTKLPLDMQLQLGVDGMNTLWSYNDSIEQQGAVETDEVLFAALQRLQAEDPNTFADDVDLFDYIDRLSTTDRRALQKLQATAVKDRREGRTEALTDAKSIATAMSIADTRLEAAGIKVTGKAANEETAQREARFQRALVDRMREFQMQNERVPNDYEVSEIVDQLLLPVVMQSPGWFGTTDSEDGFVFDAPFRADNETVALNIPYDHIPVNVRLEIREDLAKELGRDPTEDEVKAEYVETVLTGG